MRAGVAVLAVALCAAAPAAADENSDLNADPSAPRQPCADRGNAAGAAPGKAFPFEDAFMLNALRGGLVVPLPPPAPTQWQNRTSFDAAYQWKLSNELSATLSDRFNLTEQNGSSFPDHGNVRNDFREGYLTWEPAERLYLEAGRINLRDGVALGFNPTDFFKTGTLLDQASQDPSVIREDRLGVLMLRGQAIWADGSASIAVVPKVQSPTSFSETDFSGLDPRFDRTNGADRVLLSVNYDLFDLSPQALLYHEGNQTRVGLNLSRQLGQSVIAYAEWAGGRQPSLIAAAVGYGKRTGVVPANAPLLLPDDAQSDFKNDLAIGASWTSTEKITVNLEYHYHQAGFSPADWRNWFAIGAAHRNVLPITGELWFIRGYAADQQQPTAQHQVFLRADWTDAFVTNLELSAFTFVNLTDGSTLSQLSASYYLSRAWTIGAYATAALGGARSERGSQPQARSIVVQADPIFLERFSGRQSASRPLEPVTPCGRIAEILPRPRPRATGAPMSARPLGSEC